jgi:hypothetical protein
VAGVDEAGAEVDAFHPAPKGGCEIARRPAYAAAKIQHAGRRIDLSRAVSIDYKTSVTCHGKKSIETAAGDYGNVWLAFLAKARRAQVRRLSRARKDWMCLLPVLYRGDFGRDTV